MSACAHALRLLRCLTLIKLWIPPPAPPLLPSTLHCLLSLRALGLNGLTCCPKVPQMSSVSVWVHPHVLCVFYFFYHLISLGLWIMASEFLCPPVTSNLTAALNVYGGFIQYIYLCLYLLLWMSIHMCIFDCMQPIFFINFSLSNQILNKPNVTFPLQ